MNDIKYVNRLILMDKIYFDNLPNDTLRVIVDGQNIHTKEEFIKELETLFEFPRPCEGSMDRFLDWIRDLSWFNYRKIELIIKNQKDFLSTDLKTREHILDLFLELILPHWDEDVLYTVVGGKRKEFIVYLVNTILN